MKDSRKEGQTDIAIDVLRRAARRAISLRLSCTGKGGPQKDMAVAVKTTQFTIEGRAYFLVVRLKESGNIEICERGFDSIMRNSERV